MKKIHITPTIIASEGSRKDARGDHGIFTRRVREISPEEVKEQELKRLLRPFNSPVTVSPVQNQAIGKKHIRPRIYCERKTLPALV